MNKYLCVKLLLPLLLLVLLPLQSQAAQQDQCLSSWYGPGFHGRLTANGERYDMHGLTAAHKTLPFGTKPTCLSGLLRGCPH